MAVNRRLVRGWSHPREELFVLGDSSRMSGGADNGPRGKDDCLTVNKPCAPRADESARLLPPLTHAGVPRFLRQVPGLRDYWKMVVVSFLLPRDYANQAQYNREDNKRRRMPPRSRGHHLLLINDGEVEWHPKRIRGFFSLCDVRIIINWFIELQVYFIS